VVQPLPTGEILDYAERLLDIRLPWERERFFRLMRRLDGAYLRALSKQAENPKK
jgi:hypothetical protein